MIKSKSYFFTGLNGSSGHLFRTENEPRQSDFQDLFDSVPFKNDAVDSASISTAGHAKKVDDLSALTRIQPWTDNFTRFTESHQLPNIKMYSDINVGGADTVTAGTPSHGIKVSVSKFIPTAMSFYRRDFIIESDVTLASAATTILVTEAPAGSKHFNLEVNTASAYMYKVMGSAGDAAPGYLDAKVDNQTIEVVTNKLKVKYADTNSIDLSQTAAGLQADLLFDATIFDVTALNGLELLNASHYLHDNVAATITAVYTFNITTGYPKISGVYAHPASDPTIPEQFTPKGYVDYLDGMNVHTTGNENIAGIKTFTTDFPVTPIALPTTNYQVANKLYVDTLLAGSLWEVGIGLGSIQTPNTTTGNTTTGTYGITAGFNNTNNANYGVCFGDSNVCGLDYDSVLSGSNNSAQGTWALVCGGNSNSANNLGTIVVGGDSNSVTGLWSLIVGGMSNNISGSYSGTLVGVETRIPYDNCIGWSTGKISIIGDNEELRFQLRSSTTDATPTIMVNYSGTQDITLPTDCTANVLIRLVGVQTGGIAGTIGDSFVQNIEFGCINLAGTVAVVPATAATTANVHTVTADIIYKLPSKTAAFGGSVAVSFTGAKIRLTVTGEVNKNILWTAYIITNWIGFRNFTI